MRKIREVLRLKWECGFGDRVVADACAVSRSTVSKYERYLNMLATYARFDLPVIDGPLQKSKAMLSWKSWRTVVTCVPSLWPASYPWKNGTT